ncbi:MAG TPA: peptide chain release factor-like protein [Spirochaetia bacterium]|nr:peptide chain release factor-like protein [Spirochaetia bacterium]
MSKELLFSLRAKDFRVDTFRSGGPGGQNQNKRETGVRITHLASGAVGEARDERSQGQNKRIAFRRLVESQTFQVWLRIEAARAMLSEEERRAVERRVEGWMSPENLLVEFFDTGRWVPAE